MAGSIRDQLLKAGVVDKKKAKQSQHQKRKDVNKNRQNAKSGQQVAEDNTQQQIEQAAREKRERDLALNKQRDEMQAKKALAAEVRQIILQHTISIPDSAELSYNFEHDKKIKKIFIAEGQQTQLSRGQLAIAHVDQTYRLIPDKIAARIIEKIDRRLDEEIVIRIVAEVETDEDDPYADYQIPDDLIW